MLRISIVLVLIASFTYAQLILNEHDEWGRTIIVKIMQAINAHDQKKYEFVKVVETIDLNLLSGVPGPGKYNVLLEVKETGSATVSV